MLKICIVKALTAWLAIQSSFVIERNVSINISHGEFLHIFNRPGVDGAVLQTPLSLIRSFIHYLTHPFPPNLQ